MIFTSATMNLHIKDALAYLTFDSFSNYSNLVHAFSTRLGGVSTGKFKSMNMSFGRGDLPGNVTENYRRLCAAVGVEYESLTASAQTHGTYVRRVTAKDRGVGICRPKDMESVDALITNDTEVTLVTYFADCTPVLLFDPVKNAVGAAHAGWRGTVGLIAKRTVEKMTEEFGTNPADIIATVGPAISKCCYEVDTPVAHRFLALPLKDTYELVLDKGDGKYMADLLETNKRILTSAGVLPENITQSDVCTRCSSDLVWSHRSTAGKRGGMCALLAVR